MELIQCKECSENLNSLKGLCNHIKNHKINIKKYYDKWFKSPDEDKCKICGNKTVFYNFVRGYRDTCCKKCANEFRFSQIKKVFKNKYGTEFIFSVPEIILKGENTRLELYGHKNPAHGTNEIKVKKTMTEKYGSYNYGGSDRHKKEMKENWKKYTTEEKQNIKIKKEETCIERYGIKSMLCDQKEKEEGMIKKYGVKHAMHNAVIYDKNFKSQINVKKFKDTNLWYQGSYELDFLEKYYDKYQDIKRGPYIKYLYKGEKKIYHPDFYIPSLNLIVEIKSSYYFKRDKYIINKKKEACLNAGYKWKIIINKNYESFSEV